MNRLLLAFSSLILALGGLAHARAFRGAVAAISNAHLASSIYGKDFQTLWLADSTTLLAVAALFAMIAVRPSIATRTLVFVIALIPAATAILIYVFVGNFYAGHLRRGAAIAALVAALGARASRPQAAARLEPR